MKIIDIEELKIIQLSILDKVDYFCRTNDINYSLSSGTLIGCIRHKGFIPWDDDIDIYMPRKDYDRFIQTYNFFNKQTRVISLITDSNYYLAYAKVEDIRTRLIEVVDNPLEIGVNIDVFPVDGVPDQMRERINYFRKLGLLYDISTLKNISIDWKTRLFYKNIVLVISKIIFYWFSMRRISLLLDSFIKKDYINTVDVCNLTCGNSSYMSFPRNCMRSYVDMPFEDRKYKVMIGYKEYLSKTYGDFMTLPPIEKRISHHVFTAWWKE